MCNRLEVADKERGIAVLPGVLRRHHKCEEGKGTMASFHSSGQTAVAVDVAELSRAHALAMVVDDTGGMVRSRAVYRVCAHAVIMHACLWQPSHSCTIVTDL
jgi:hypothetical protein